MTLAEQIEALCDQHGLTSLSITYNRYEGGGEGYTVYAHGRDHLGSNMSVPTPAQAVEEAIADLNARRNRPAPVAELVAA